MDVSLCLRLVTAVKSPQEGGTVTTTSFWLVAGITLFSSHTFQGRAAPSPLCPHHYPAHVLSTVILLLFDPVFLAFSIKLPNGLVDLCSHAHGRQAVHVLWIFKVKLPDYNVHIQDLREWTETDGSQ